MQRLFPILLASMVLCHASLAETQPEEFSFRYEEGLLWVQAKTADNAEPLNLLLDTGAEVSVLDLGATRRLTTKLGRPVTVRGVGSSTTGYWPVKVRARVGSADLPSKFLALDLSELGKACNQRVDGLIGADFFRDHVVRIDFESRRISRWKGRVSSGTTIGLPLEVGRRGMQVMARVNGLDRQRLRVDTGCASALQWVKEPSADAEARVTGTVATGLSHVRIPQTHTTVRLGEHTFRDVPTGLHEKPIFPGEAGLLGSGLLGRFRSVTFDTLRGRLVLSL